MKVQIAFITGLLLWAPTTARPDVKAPNGRTIDCFCTDTSGSRVELGQSICLYVNGRAFTARCEMSLNVPMWRETGDGCLSSSLSKPGQPAQSTVSVYPKI